MDAPTPDMEWDWTNNYNKWTSWQRELDQAETVERVRLKAQRKRDKMDHLKHMTCCSDHSEEQRIFDMSPKEQLVECDGFKREGMLFYSEGQFFRVCCEYVRLM